MIKKIYFDLDGVLADFDRGLKELCGMEFVSQTGRTPEEDEQMWQAIRKVEHFYDRLELMPKALEMFQYIHRRYGERCEILTGIPKPKRGIATAGDDKISWAHRMLDESLKVNIVYREEKKYYATGKDCILIDDLAKNIEEWELYGGTGILYTSAEDVIARIRELS